VKGGVEPTQANSFFELLGSIKEKRSHSNQGIYPNADEAAKKKHRTQRNGLCFFGLAWLCAQLIFFLPQLGSMHSCVFFLPQLSSACSSCGCSYVPIFCLVPIGLFFVVIYVCFEF
jgi:hypothetical protein